MFGAFGKMLPESCLSFVSQAAHCNNIKSHLSLERVVAPVRRTRQLSKESMVLNYATPRIDINPESFDVSVDGQRIDIKPAEKVALGQLYWFS